MNKQTTYNESSSIKELRASSYSERHIEIFIKNMTEVYVNAGNATSVGIKRHDISKRKNRFLARKICTEINYLDSANDDIIKSMLLTSRASSYKMSKKILETNLSYVLSLRKASRNLW